MARRARKGIGAGVVLPSPQMLEEELRLHQCSTRECIEQYYLDKLKQVGAWPGWGPLGTPLHPAYTPPPPSSQAPQNCYGRLNVRCHYEAAEQRLVVAVLHAADLPPLDANGERADSRVQGPGAQQEGFLAYSPHPRSKRPLRDRGTGSSTSLPDDTQPEDAGEEPHTAPRV